MPTLQQLRYLVALADVRHFRHAAEACHVTQPTLSAQLRELERRLGVRLVEQGRPRVLLTPLGLSIAERGRIVLREVDGIRALARAGSAAGDGTIRLGVAQTLGSYLLPLVIPDLQDGEPAQALVSREEAPGSLVRHLEAGILDLLVVPLPLPKPGFEARAFLREPILLVVHRDHPLAQAPSILLSDLQHEVVLGPGPGHPLHAQVRDICEAAGARLSCDHEGTNLDGLRQMVAQRMGVSLMPALYVRSEVVRHDRVVAREFRHHAPERLIGLAWRRGAVREREYLALAHRMAKILRRVPEVSLVEPGEASNLDASHPPDSTSKDSD